MTDIFKRVYDDIVRNRERKLSGLHNCIPWGLPRFEQVGNPGIQQGRYYIVTANSKVFYKLFVLNLLFQYNILYQYYKKKLKWQKKYTIICT